MSEGKMDKAAYKSRLKELQKRLNLLQHAMARQGLSGIVVLEGWDAAGKGGVIRRIAWALDPRHLKVWSIGAPSPAEKRQHWLKRFWQRLPDEGEIAVFDRSWYGRVLVEPIEGFASREEAARAYREINEFENMLTDEGLRMVKLFLDITPQTQYRRFEKRFRSPQKRWKMTREDLRNRARWREYEEAYERMIAETSTPAAPWVRIDANEKRAARLACLEEILKVLGAGIDVTPPPADPEVKAFFDDRKNAKP